MNSDNIKPPTALLVGVNFGSDQFDTELMELALLVQSAGIEPVARLCCKRKVPDAALMVGSGKAQEIKDLAQMHGAQEIFFDQALSPGQQRNLERFMGMPVNDRIYLILEIFAQRARSYEGKLQVELARLRYLSTRLVRRWSHLERQRGGIGARGGPGETQIELDRRMIDDAIKRAQERLKKVELQRRIQRKQRARAGTPIIAIVGYTNAGKSTLFNALVKAGVYVADQLFATLDTTTRQIYLGEEAGGVSLSDTVGFIKDLPHGLVDAFKATLLEAVDADLLLHVVDASNEHFALQIAQVNTILEEIGAHHASQLLIFNKLDALADEPVQKLGYYDVNGQSLERIFVSAKTGEGLTELRQKLAQWVVKNRQNRLG